MSIELENFWKISVLPEQITENGLDSEPLIEVMICDMISGGARYRNHMPIELSLIRKLADGTEYQMTYVQAPEKRYTVKKETSK